MASGENPVAMGSAHPNLVPYRAFEAKDGWFVLGVGSDAQWATVVDRLHLHHPEANVAWATNQGRVLDRDAVEKSVATAIALHNRTDLESMLDGVPCAPVNTVLEALADPQSVARQAITQHKGVDVLASPLRFMATQNEKSDV